MFVFEDLTDLPEELWSVSSGWRENHSQLPTAKQRQYESKQQPQLSTLQPLMMKPGLSDSKSGSISEQRGIDTHSIRVRFNINEVEEDRRTERGIQARRERKENNRIARAASGRPWRLFEAMLVQQIF